LQVWNPAIPEDSLISLFIAKSQIPYQEAKPEHEDTPDMLNQVILINVSG
jgi:hypothetical protein